MPKRTKWYETGWGLAGIIALFLISAILLIWLITAILNSGFMVYLVIAIGALAVTIVAGAIFSEGFRSFLLRTIGRRR